MGMGHFFRAINFIDFLKEGNISYIIFINNNEMACKILKERGLKHEIVDLEDFESGWEKKLISKYGINAWINDRLNTDITHAQYIKEQGIKLVTFDDRGIGATISDIHVAALPIGNEDCLTGKKILTGLEYLILNKEIFRFRRVRKKIENIIVTLGGSDTYGVTIKVARMLKKLNKKATLHIGPSFKHLRELEAEINENFTIIKRVPSLVEVFYEYDLAITGGGITPFEANASGLPCIIIANEVFEIGNGRFLDELGSSVFAGYHKELSHDIFCKDLDIEKMSSKGINTISLNGAENIYREIQSL
jgi:spore coat polysaccharide biosynthesis predicted glycosyltransferase SpsG